LKIRHLMLVIILTIAARELPALAHHSFAAVFDMSGTLVKVTGTVTRFDFVNPHGFVYLDVKEPSGTVAKWKFEVTNPNALLRLGWTKETLKAGDVVTVEGPRAKDGTNFGMGRTWILPDGRQVFGNNPDAGR
jgi:Family of unknown function (DUF6152)